MVEERQLVGFFIAKEEYGINIQEVQEIIREQVVTHIPGAPAFMEGIISIRGKIIPVISIRRRFGLPDLEKSDTSRIIVVNIEDKTLGIAVDEVSEVLRLAENAIDPPPHLIVGQGKDYIEGIGQLNERLLIILNLNALFSLAELDLIQKSLSKAPETEKPAPEKKGRTEKSPAKKKTATKAKTSAKTKPRKTKNKKD